MVWFQDKLLKLISQDKTEEILSQYGKIKVANLEPLSGWQNLGLKFTTSLGNFVLRIQRKNEPEKLKFSLDVIEYLSESGIPVPKIFATKKGEKIIYVKLGRESYLAVLFEFLPGSVKIFLTDSEINKIGQLIGKLHNLLGKFNFKTKLAKIDLIKDAKNIQRKLSLILTDLKDLEKLWTNFEKNEETLLQNSKTLSKIQLIHGDLAPSNILFNDGEITGLVDFDLVQGPKIWDLANFVGNYFHTVKSYGERVEIGQILKSFQTGFEKTFKLSPQEKQLLPEIIRLWFFEKIVWAKKESFKKYRREWANDVILWSLAGLAEKF